ncbi:MAG: type II secretion system protein N [Burkholderiaceae bacterium]
MAIRQSPSPRLALWGLAGALAGTLAALVLFAPAWWLADAIESATSGRLLLAQPRGTVWNGSAQLVLTGGEGSRDAAALPGSVRWRLRPGLGGLSAAVESDCCTREPVAVKASPRWGGMKLEVADAQSQWPAAVLAGLGTPWNTLQIEGNLGVSTRGLSVEWVAGRLAIAGSARLEAAQLSSRLSTLRPMGSYSITLNGGPVPTLQLQTLEGALRLTGSGGWAGTRFRFNGEATAEPEREAALANLLNIIGRRSGGRSLITIG